MEIARLGVVIDATGAEVGAKRVQRATGGMMKSFGGLKGVIAGLGLGLVFRKMVKDSADFQQSIADLSAITGATGKDLEYLTQKSKEFGETTTLTASQSAEAFKLIASAKPDLLENGVALAEVTKNAITLAEAAGTTLPQAAKTLGGALNQFNASADQSARFMNVLAAGAKYGASEIPDTADAMRFAGTVAASMGVSFEEANSAIQQLAKVSIKGTEAGAALRNVMLRLEASADKNLRPSVVGLQKAIENLSAKNLNAADLNKLFGLRAVTAAQQLINQKDALGQLTAKLTDTDTAWEQAAKKVDTLEGDVKTLNSAIEAFSITNGDKMNPGLREMVQTLTLAVRSWNEWANAGDNADGIMSTLAGTLRGALVIINGFVFSVQTAAGAVVAFYKGLGALSRGESFSSVWDKYTESVKTNADQMVKANDKLMNFKQTQEEMIAKRKEELEFDKEWAKATADLDREVGKQEEDSKRKLQELNDERNAAASALEAIITPQEKYNEKLKVYAKWLKDIPGFQAEYNKLKKAADDELAKSLQQDPLVQEQMAREEALKKEVIDLSESYKTQTQIILDSLAERKAALEEANINGQISDQVEKELRIKTEEDTQAKLTKIMKDGVVERNAFEILSAKQKTEVLLGQADKYLGMNAQHSKAAFEAQKAINIAQATMDTYSAATAAYKSLAGIPIVGPALGAAAAALAVTAGLANIQQIKSQQFKGYAKGGYVSGNDPILVGEKGPEIFQPSGAGNVIPNHKLGGNVNVVNNFHISAPNGRVDPRSIQQIQTATGQAINRAVQRNG